MSKYHFISNKTGELATTLKDVFRIVWFDFRRHGILNLSWSYSRKGY